MWSVLRPDAIAVLRDEKAQQVLSRYFAVMENSLPARFHICARVEIKTTSDSSETELWKKHESGLRELNRLQKRVDEKKMKIEDLPKPEFSLLDLKIELANKILRSCRFCERRCQVDRTSGRLGVCGVGTQPRIASEFMHYGEEPELVPSYTIFFSGCTFKCVFCQNWDISQYPDGGALATPRALAMLIKKARQAGARNVNWVGGEPTPNLHAILEALSKCEVNIPSVWNSNMYLSSEAMRLLAGTQDVYLTDFKYGNDRCAERYSGVKNYFEIVSRNHMLASKDAELIIRHLVMPNHVECCTKPVLEWLAENLGPNTRVNLMDQYRPCYRADEYEEINRRITSDEFSAALKIAEEVGLQNVIT